MLKTILSSLAFLGLVVTAGSIYAQEAYPNKPITIIVPFASGSGSDITARSLGKDITALLKQPVVVLNRPGANGAIGAAAAASAPADGYTLFIGSATTQAANFALKQANIGYKPDSLAMVSGLGSSPIILYVSQHDPNPNLVDLVQNAKKNVGKLSCSSGNAVTEVACAIFKKQAGLFAPTISYRSNALSLQDLATGIVSFSFSDPSAALALVDSKRVRPLAIASATRAAGFPDIPTFVESGYKDMDITAWTGLFAPAGTPADVLAKLNAAVKMHVESAETKAFMARYGGQALWMDVSASAKFLQTEQSKWERFVKSTGVTPNM